CAEIITSAPKVRSTVTIGPIVFRSAYSCDVDCCDAITQLWAGACSLMEFRAVVTKRLPFLDAFAGAISFKLSRISMFSWAAVSTVPGVKVVGTVQTIATHLQRENADVAGGEATGSAVHPVLHREDVRARG